MCTLCHSYLIIGDCIPLHCEVILNGKIIPAKIINFLRASKRLLSDLLDSSLSPSPAYVHVHTAAICCLVTHTVYIQSFPCSCIILSLSLSLSLSSPSLSLSTTGLLTVDAKNRLTLDNLTTHPWLAPQSAPSTPLQTSCVLERDRGTASALKQTFHAFIQATRAGFTLGDVSRAPLAKRRKRKRGLSPANPANATNDSHPSSSEVSGSVSSLSDTGMGMGIGNGSASESGTPNCLSVSPIPHHARPSQLEL